jgi:1-pyrroline-5-carboxylate dehydrogenase
MTQEIFGPVITVSTPSPHRISSDFAQVYVYDDEKYEETLELIDTTTEYGLTGAIFAQERAALVHMASKLRHAAGNFYINDKCTGAVVGQQPFGGARASGTNDKSGSMSIFSRFVVSTSPAELGGSWLNFARLQSMRSIKENFVAPTEYHYPSNLV